MAQPLIKSTWAKAFAFITTPDDVELWCEFSPQSKSAAALTAVIDGRSVPGVVRGLRSFVFTHDLAPASRREAI